MTVLFSQISMFRIAKMVCYKTEKKFLVQIIDPFLENSVEYRDGIMSPLGKGNI